jgi:hypothetical protein
MEAVYSLERPSCIKSIYLCNFGSAIIEVLVSGDGDGEDYNNFVTLLPPKMLMSPQDSKKGLNRTGNVTFTSDKFSQHAMGRKWSSVLVRCQQPFKKEDQFGLSSLILSSSSEIPTNVCTPSPLPGPSATNSSKSSTTPRAVYNDGSPQMKKVNRKEDVLLLLSSPTSAGPTYKLHSSAMEKLMQERTQQQCTNSSLLAKRKEMRRVQLLKQSVPKSFSSSDYMETYAARPSKDKSLDFSPINRAVSLGLMLDTSEQVDKNKCWSTRKRHMKERVAITDWLSAKKVSSKETSLCRGNKVNEPFVDEEDDIVLVKQIDTSKELNVKDPADDVNVECPLCGKFFPKPVIEIHSSVCADDLIAFKSSSYKANSTHSMIVLD